MQGCISDPYEPCCPFSFLKSELGVFYKSDIVEATGIAFVFRNGPNCIWAYQHLCSIMVPNKSNKGKIEYLIDLLDERYTISEITGTEYDTGVKKPIEEKKSETMKE